MLILARRRDFPDHAMNAAISAKRCDGSWWFECDWSAGSGKNRRYCGRVHRVSCDGGAHISLPEAEAALRQAHWRLRPAEEGGGWLCPDHS